MARLTTKTRGALPASDFAGHGRTYPINNLSHAREAIAMVDAHGGPALQERVKAAVHRKYPGIKISK